MEFKIFTECPICGPEKELYARVDIDEELLAVTEKDGKEMEFIAGELAPYIEHMILLLHSHNEDEHS